MSIYILFLLCIGLINAEEMFTAMADMEQLLKVEDVLITNLKTFIAEQDSKLKSLEKQIKNYVKNHETASKDISEYLANPINAYLMTKRLTRDWEDVESMLQFNASEAVMKNVSFHQKTLKFPSKRDLTGAASALTRLQETYNLNASDIADGKINGIYYNSKMSADDCYELGLQAFLNKDNRFATQWLKEAVKRLPKDNYQLHFDILGYLSLSLYNEGDIKGALDVTEQIIKMAPFNEMARKNRKYFQEKLFHDQNNPTILTDENQFEPKLPQKIDAFIYDDFQRDQYEKICRQENPQSPKQTSKLHCRYVTNGNKFITIAPLKLEESSIDPYIVTFHNVISDAEIETLKTLSMPLLKTAKVSFADEEDQLRTEIRTGKLAWLPKNGHKIIKTLDQRIEDMTGLSMSSAELLQVLNYGVGGHYEPHFDWNLGHPESEEDLVQGDRIGTVLFYMSDVIQGGATVFPLINVALWPKKGSAAFWYNLHASGKGDLRTKHAACPILVGTKWVCNKWIHENNNEFRRPCKLEQDHPEDRNEYFNK